MKSLQSQASVVSDNEKENQPIASLHLQIFIYFDGYYMLFYAIVQFLTILYKFSLLYYPKQVQESEFTMFIIFLILYKYRHYQGNLGNQTQSYIILSQYFLLSIPIILGFCYFLRLQTYVTMTEVALNSIGIFFVTLQVLLSIPAIIKYKKIEQIENLVNL